MFLVILSAFFLVALTVTVHVVGLALLLGHMKKRHAALPIHL